jgi:hypothetical protein
LKEENKEPFKTLRTSDVKPLSFEKLHEERFYEPPGIS